MNRNILLFGAAAALMLTACGGTKEYDSYVADLEKQPAIIDTISSGASYADYLQSLIEKGENFDNLDVKLTPEQKDEISMLSMKIQEALTAKYNQLAQTPMLIPDSFAVPE